MVNSAWSCHEKLWAADKQEIKKSDEPGLNSQCIPIHLWAARVRIRYARLAHIKRDHKEFSKNGQGQAFNICCGFNLGGATSPCSPPKSVGNFVEKT